MVTVAAISINDRDGAEPRGAFINVYTTATSEQLAREVALREVAEAGWHCVNVEKVAWHTEDRYLTDETGKEYFHQALIDGIVLVSHEFPTLPGH